MSRLQRKQMIWHILLLAGILLVFLAEFAYMSNAPQLVDERTNWKQISIFLKEEIRIQGGLNVFPAYHALIAAVMLVFHLTGISSARFITIWISFASVVLFYLLAWKVCSRPS